MTRLIILLLSCLRITMPVQAGLPSFTALDSVTVQLDSLANATCNGGSNGAAFVSVTAGTAPFTFLWSNGDTLQNADSLAAGIYGLTVTDADGDQAVLDGIEIGEPLPIEIAVISIVTPGCNGQLGALEIEANGGTAPYHYLWNTGETSSQLPDLSAADYTATVTDGNGCTGTISISLQPSYPIAALNADGNVTCAHPSVALDGSASSQGGDFSFSWTASNGGQFTSALDSLVVTTDAAGTYTLVITDTLTGCSSSAPVDVEVDTMPPFVDAGQDLDLPCTNSTATLSGSGPIAGNFTYHWQAENGGNVTSGADSPTPSIDHVGSFILTVTNLDNGCPASDTLTVSGLNAPPSFTVGGGTLTCNITSIQLATDLDSVGIVFGWTRDSSFSSSELHPIVDEPGAYVLMATDTTTTCSYVRTAVVLENTTPPTVEASGGTITCVSTTATIVATAVGDNLTFEWSGPNSFVSNASTAQVDAPGEYALVVTDTLNGCTTLDTAIVNEDFVAPIADAGAGGTINCSNPTLLLDGSGSSQGAEYTYLWTTANGQFAEGETTLTPTVNAPGNYTLTVTNTLNGCTDDDGDVVVDADFTAPTGVSAQGGTITCFEPTLVLTAGYDPTNANFAWSSDNGFFSTELNPTVGAGGEYHFAVTDTLNGCSTTATATVTAFLDAPDLALTGGTITCSSPAVNIQTVVLATGVVFYWAGPNNFSSSEQNPTVALPGLYEVVGQDTVYGCISLDSVRIEMDTVPPTADAGSGFVLNCNIAEGQLDGAASSQGNYSYVWTTLDGNIAEGETTLTPTVHAPGTYTLNVTSQTNGCVAADDVVVTQATPVNVQILDLQNVSCHGTATGSASVVGVGGTGDYSYVWSSGSLSGTTSGLVAGNYSVVVTDGDGCTVSFILSIGQPDILLANLSANGQSLPGVNDGFANANPTGGTGPYYYAWSNGLTTQGMANLAPGAYTLTVTDDKGCTAVETANVNEFPCTLTGSLTLSQVKCFGEANGSALVILSNATLPITYDWSNGATLAMADNLAAGIYSVSVSDSTNCSLQFTFEITQPTEISVFELFHEDAPCPTDATGSVGVAVNGGVQPYQYLWSNGSTGAMSSGLSVGEHSLTLTDANGCGQVLATTILGTDDVPPTVVVQDNITVSLSANGTTSVLPDQFDAGSTDNCGIVAWSVTPDAFDCSHLGEQVVTITATDANGNTNSALATVTVVDQIAPLLACPGNVTLSNCDPELTFLLPVVEDNCAVDYSQVALTAGLPSGSGFPLGETLQTFSYADAAGNAGECSFTVTVVPSLAVSYTSDDVSCAGACDGIIELSPNFGILPYQVLWSNGVTDAAISGLCAGNYAASISDAGGCQVTVTLDISEPAPLDISLLDATNPVCPEGLTGSIAINVAGGSTPYNFDWSNGNGTTLLQNLGTGTYSLLLTDAHGCTASFGQTLTATDNQAPVLALQDVTVSLGANGTAMVSPAMFDNGSTDNCGIVSWTVSSNGFDCGNLGTQTVTLTATDANGNVATGTASVTVVDSTPPTLLCPANISVGFCAPAVQFALPLASDNCAINPASLLQTAGLAAGAIFPTGLTTQSFSYTDAAGNVGTCSFTVTVNSAATIASSIETVSCNDECDGSVTLTVSGGFAPFSFLWSNGQTTPTANGLCAGSVSGTVTDAGNCQQVITAAITEPAALGFNVNTVSPDVNGTGLGSIGITVNGGTTPYSYAWTKNGLVFSNAEDLGNLNTGDYAVVVTDANGCTITSQNIFVDNLTGTAEPVWAANLRLFPNPASNWTTLELGTALAQDAELTVLDPLGKQAMFAELKKGEASKLLDLRGLPAGAYVLRIRVEGEVVVKRLLVSE